MIGHIRELITSAIEGLQRKGVFDMDGEVNFNIERTRDSKHGDYACNVALVLAKPLRKAPRAIAEMVNEELAESSHVSKTEIAKRNFFVKKEI